MTYQECPCCGSELRLAKPDPGSDTQFVPFQACTACDWTDSAAEYARAMRKQAS